MLISDTGSAWQINSYTNGHDVQLRGRNASGNGKLCISADPDGASSLYYAGTQKLLTDTNGIIVKGTTPTVYIGDIGTDGSWRIRQNGDDLIFQQRESGSWNTKSTFSGA